MSEAPPSGVMRARAEATGRVSFGSQAEMVETLAIRIGEHIQGAIQARGVARLALSGGGTPAPLYRRLARADLPIAWPKVAVTLVDERWVPPGHADSNETLVRKSLHPRLDDLPAQGMKGATFAPMWRAGASPEAAAAAFDAAFAGRLDPLDLVVLGMGDDGHTASLFPNSPALTPGLDPAGAANCIAVPAGAPAPAQPRLTLTLAAILRARRIVLLLTGEAKLETLERALAGDDAAAMPVRAVLHAKNAPLDIAWAP